MNRPPPHPSGQSAGWVIAAIVAVVAVCAISFMISQRPREAIAIAAGDTATSRTPLGSQTAPPVQSAPPTTTTRRPAGAAPMSPADLAGAEPGMAFNAGDAVSNAAAIEPAH